MVVGRKHPAKIQVLVVDEHPLFRDGAVNLINQQFDMVACGNAHTIPCVQSVLPGCKPDLILLGLQLGTGDTLEFIKALKAQYPELRILVFSQFEETLFAERALRAGANGYLMKHAPNEELLTAIREIVRGEIYVSRKIAMLAFQKSLETPRQNDHQCQCNHASIQSLSDREIHVFQLLGSGLGTRKIAEALNLSAKTIESHRENIISSVGLFSYGVWTDWHDVVAGPDPREGGDSDMDNADVLQCRTQNPDGSFSADMCPWAGGLDSNIYGSTTP
jgi:DNA-binding NarL/FixJ family response regulator